MTAVTLRQLQFFLAVAESGSVSAAARRCHVSPGGISLAVTQLESTLGVPLTVRRKSKGAVLTPTGRWVAQRARALLADAEELESGARRLQEDLFGPLRIGCFTTLSPALMPSIVEHFATHHPAVDIDIVEESSVELSRMLRAGEIDACLAYALHLQGDIDRHRIAPVRLQVLLAPTHPLARKEEISLVELADEPAALLSLQPAQDLVETVLRGAGFEPTITWRSRNAETVRSLVGRGLAYSIMMTRPPDDRTYEGLPLAYRRIADDLPDNALVLGCPRGVPPSGKITALIDYCRSEFGDESSPPGNGGTGIRHVRGRGE